MKAFFETESQNYPIICLFKHDGIDLANMTKDEFIKTMSEDLNRAQANYEELMAEPMRKARAEYLEKERERHTKFAKSKWKTEKHQNRYIDEMMSKAEASGNYTNLSRIYFDIKPEKGRMGIAGCCSLYPGDSESKLSRCFDEIKDSKYFRGGHGWVFRYEGLSMNFPISCCRPDIDILLPDDLAAEQKQDEKNLNAAVAKFYEGTTYFGD
jgi:hypothetical protein